MSVPRSVDPSAPQPFDFGGLNANTLIQAMLDLHSQVVVLDTELRVLALNAAAAAVLKARGVESLEPIYTDFAAPGMLSDRVSIIREVLLQDDPIACEGMLDGTWQRTTFRRVYDASAQAYRVLVLGEAAAEMASAGGIQHKVVRAQRDHLGVLESITEREAEVLRLIGHGMSASDIATKLHRSIKTVQGHRNALGHKLGANNRVDLARIALQSGLTGLPADEVRAIWRRSRPARMRLSAPEDELGDSESQ